MEITSITVESPLGRWTQSEWRPAWPARLAALVDSMWHFEGRMTLPRERTFPAGHAELILHLGPRFRDVTPAGESADAFPVLCASGVQTGPQVVEAPAAPVCVLGVRLRPVGLYALCARPLHELSDVTVDVADLAGRAALELAERCHEAATVADRFRCVTRWIEARLALSPGPLAAVAWAAARLARSHGGESIAALRDQAGMGTAPSPGCAPRSAPTWRTSSTAPATPWPTPRSGSAPPA